MERTSAYMDGWHSHKGGQEQSNPYSEAYQPYSYRQWLAGWCDRFSAIKHELDLSLDENMGF